MSKKVIGLEGDMSCLCVSVVALQHAYTLVSDFSMTLAVWETKAAKGFMFVVEFEALCSTSLALVQGLASKVSSPPISHEQRCNCADEKEYGITSTSSGSRDSSRMQISCVVWRRSIVWIGRWYATGCQEQARATPTSPAPLARQRHLHLLVSQQITKDVDTRT